MNRIFLTFCLLLASALAVREVEHYQKVKTMRPSITVYVAGAVTREGAVTLPAGSRRIHAVAEAGGVLGTGDLGALEPAKPLQDGETLLIPFRSLPRARREAPLPRTLPPEEPHELVPDGHSEPPQYPIDRGGKLNLNQATAEQLQELPGIGPVLARRIVEARNAQPEGTFATIEDLGTIRGIKGKTTARLAPYLELEAYDR